MTNKELRGRRGQEGTEGTGNTQVGKLKSFFTRRVARERGLAVGWLERCLQQAQSLSCTCIPALPSLGRQSGVLAGVTVLRLPDGHRAGSKLHRDWLEAPIDEDVQGGKLGDPGRLLQ